MASGTVMTHLAYLNNLAQNSKAPAVYVGNNPFNAQYEKPESETDKQLARLKMKTEQARASSLESGSALALQKFQMTKEKNALDMQIKRNALKTQSDLANNIDIFDPSVDITEDTTTMEDGTPDQVFSNGAQADQLTKDLEEMKKKQGFKALTQNEKDFEAAMTAINDDRTMTPNDKIEAKMKLGKDFGLTPVDKNNKAIDKSETIGDAAEWTWDAIVDPLKKGVSKFGNMFRTDQEDAVADAASDQYQEYQDEYSGTHHKENLFQRYNKIKIQRKKNDDIRANMERLALKRIKEQSVTVIKKVKVEHNGAPVSKATLDSNLKQALSKELNRIRNLKITDAAKVSKSKDAILAIQTKRAEWQAKQDAKAKALEELRKQKEKL